jgi:hypothetical protein
MRFEILEKSRPSHIDLLLREFTTNILYILIPKGQKLIQNAGFRNWILFFSIFLALPAMHF